MKEFNPQMELQAWESFCGSNGCDKDFADYKAENATPVDSHVFLLSSSVNVFIDCLARGWERGRQMPRRTQIAHCL